MTTALLPAPPADTPVPDTEPPALAAVLTGHTPTAGPDTGQTPTRCARCTVDAGTPIPWPCTAVYEVADVETRPQGWELRPHEAP
ncbi:hypothetical protein ACIGZJ_30800 [Kitasatospora sp. NPDC052868]|uniref:hypothetical protein n=1 Tax=Kitasatospora sp. NPDC052868 TaxID=3364060 RepID=UPI0037C83475